MNKAIFSGWAMGVGVALLGLAWPVAAENFNIQVGDTISDGTPGVGAGRITVNSESDFYTFSGSAGQNIFVEEISAASSLAGWLRWELKSPGNVTVFSSYLEGNNEGRRTLPETGTYTLRVWVGAVNAAYVGAYAFRLRAVPPDQTFAIQIGDTITNNVPAVGAGNLEVAGAWDYYTFSATNGQLVFLEISSTASTFQGNLFCELKSPGSNTVVSSYITGGNHLGRRLLPETGTYRLRIFAQSNGTNHVGNYSLRLWNIPADQVFAIQPGDVVTNNAPAPGAGNIEGPGAQDLYTFAATAGQSLTFEAIAKSTAFAGWLQWEVKTPSGASLFANYFTDGGRKTLPETGVYTIRVWVGANQPGYIGTYAFRIYTLPGDVRLNIQKGQVISDGVPVVGAGRIDEPGGLDTYFFSGLAGQRVNFDQLAAASEFGGWLYWQVVAPSGTNWFGGYFPGNIKSRRTLPESGLYTIRIYANSVNAAYVGFYSLRTWCEVVALPDQVATLPNTTLAIPTNKLLCDDSLELGDTATIELTNQVSRLGGLLAITNGMVMYSPPAGFQGVDDFTYRLVGQFGDDDFASVTVRVGPGVDQGATVVSWLRETPTSVAVCLLGQPNQIYHVEQSTDLVSWARIGQLVADETGALNYGYVIAPVEKCFYRFPKQ